MFSIEWLKDSHQVWSRVGDLGAVDIGHGGHAEGPDQPRDIVSQKSRNSETSNHEPMPSDLSE